MQKLESEIDSLQNSVDEKDMECVNILKEELQGVEDQKDMMNARKYLAKNKLEGERPTKFFCAMNQKMKSRAQFKEVHVREKNDRGEESVRVVRKQSSVEWEVQKFYWNLYR